MNVTSPKYTNERSAITPRAARTAPTPRDARRFARGRRRRRGGSLAAAAARAPAPAAISQVGISTNTVPCSPNTSSSGVISTGPSAKPTLPPTLNRLIPLGAARARDVVGKPRSLGVERRDADAAEHDRRERQRVGRRQSRRGHAEPAERGPERHQPRQATGGPRRARTAAGSPSSRSSPRAPAPTRRRS